MDATLVRDQLTEGIRTDEQLGRNAAVLVRKLEARDFQDEWLIGRVDRSLGLQQRLARYDSSRER